MPIKILAYAAVAVAIVIAIVISFAPNADVSQTDTLAHQLIGESYHSDGKVVTGPDGFPYVIGLRDAAAPGATYPMQALAKRALAQRAGVAIYQKTSAEAQAVAVFSLGGTMLLADGDWSSTASGINPTLRDGEHVTFGTPSRKRLPQPLRDAVAAWMQRDGIAHPKIAMMAVQNAAGESRGDLMMTVNVPRSAYRSDTDWQNALHRVAWFIPSSIDFVRPPSDAPEFDQIFRGIKPVSD